MTLICSDKFFLRQLFEILLGLNLCFDFREGQKKLKFEFSKHGLFFARIFEIGRRFKINNPDKMRSNYGKLICILQDLANPNTFDFKCNAPISTVESYLSSLNCTDLLQEKTVDSICRVVDLRVLSIEQQQQLAMEKKKCVSELHSKFVESGRMTSDQLNLILNSISDGNNYVAQSRHPVDRMINYLKLYFSETEEKKSGLDDESSLAIMSGRGGSCLTHSHSTQFKFVFQTLQLWREIQNQMFRLWMVSEREKKIGFCLTFFLRLLIRIC